MGTWEEEKHISRNRFKDAISLQDAASICLISEERLHELAKAGFAPCFIVDSTNYWFNRKEIFNWAKENLVIHQPGMTLPRTMKVIEHAKANPLGVPEILVPIFHQLREMTGDGYGPCVYFLIHGKEVVYIGQSKALASRVDSHRTNKVFNRVLYMPCPIDGLNEVESSLIRKFRPKYNLSQSNSELLLSHKKSLQEIGFNEPGEAK